MIFVKWYKFLKTLSMFGAIAWQHDNSKTDDYLAPVVVTKSGIILDGNTRVRIAKKLGLTHIRAVVLDTEVELIEIDKLEAGY